MRHGKSLFVSLFTFLSLASVSAHAEENRVGFFLGTNLSSLGTDPDIDTGTDSNLMFGAFAEFGLSDTFYIEPQLRFIEKGADISNYAAISPGSDAEVSLTLKYLEVPLLFKWKFREGEALRPFAFIGPSLGFKIGDTTTITSRTTGKPLNVGRPLGENVRTIDFAAEAGGGLEFHFTDEFSARLSAAYSRGLLDVNETGSNWKTRGLQFYAGLGFVY